jgi:hypothetical protein
MSNRLERYSALTGIAAVVLWIVGLFASHLDSISDHATDLQILAWVQGNSNRVLLGIWLFMVGCLCFLWFAGILRARLVAAEGGTSTFSSIAFAGALMTAAFGVLMNAGDVGIAIEKNDISASAAGALHQAGTVFFVAAELSAIPLLVAVAVLGFRTGVVPRWWAIVSLLVAVVLLIGPIGWAGLIFGLPVWTLVTSLLLVRVPAHRSAATVAPAVA